MRHLNKEKSDNEKNASLIHILLKKVKLIN